MVSLSYGVLSKYGRAQQKMLKNHKSNFELVLSSSATVWIFQATTTLDSSNLRGLVSIDIYCNKILISHKRTKSEISTQKKKY